MLDPSPGGPFQRRLLFVPSEVDRDDMLLHKDLEESRRQLLLKIDMSVILGYMHRFLRQCVRKQAIDN